MTNARSPDNPANAGNGSDSHFLANRPEWDRRPIAEIERNLSDQEIHKVFQKLSRALKFSMDCDRSRWDFAVQILDLDHDGVSHETLRWMLGKGLIDHAIESGDARGIGRVFESPGAFAFNSRSCFVLTSRGLEFESSEPAAASFLPAEDGNGSGSSEAAGRPKADFQKVREIIVPQWDPDRHELWLAGNLVKRYRVRAVNQECLLAAFEEDGWPSRIDDPLPPILEADSKRRLSDAIKGLNRRQVNSLIRFSGDGTGEGVLWELRDQHPAGLKKKIPAASDFCDLPGNNGDT